MQVTVKNTALGWFVMAMTWFLTFFVLYISAGLL